MPLSEHVEEFFGKSVVDHEPGKPLPDPARFAPRLGVDWDRYQAGEKVAAQIAAVSKDPGAAELQAIVIGPWDYESSSDSAELVRALADASPRFPRLAAIFLGDIVMEEQEISWIQQSDVSPLLEAYPMLEELRVRGGTGLALSRPDHARLRKLVIETGGLPREVVRSVARADLPALRHLELWLGTDNYGGDATVDDVRPILEGTKLPSLRYLGLRDAEIADDLAAAAARAPILSRVRVLDLSLGTLSDAGAQHLAASPAVAALEKLDLHHHYVSPAWQEKLSALRPVQVELSDPQEADEDDPEYRYCAVSE